MPIPIEVILGSGGLAAFAVWAVNALWKAHLEQDKRERDRADALESRLNRIADKIERSPKSEPPE